MAAALALTPVQASRARSALRTLRSTHLAIEGCAFLTSDGRVVASALGPDTDADRFGAMCAALIALASRAAREAARGELQQLYWGGRLGASDSFPKAEPRPGWASFDSSYSTTPQEYAGS